MIKILRIIFLFLTIWMGTINIMKFFRGESISKGNFIIMSIGITGLIAIQLNLL